MSTVSSGLVSASNMSAAWLMTLREVRAARGGTMFHVLTRIDTPLPEAPAIRRVADALLVDQGYPTSETVANTIFPQAMASGCAGAEDLAARYRTVYPRLRRLSPANARGTYFGRIVAFPAPGGPHDQLTALINKLKSESSHAAPKTARYEVGIAAPHDVGAETRAEQDADAVGIHAPDQDTAIQGFPCLSMCSFQLDGPRVHMMANYRSQYLVRRRYGNYLGLSRLQAYVAEQAGLTAGRLTIVVGRAQADAGVAVIEKHTGGCELPGRLRTPREFDTRPEHRRR